VTMAHQAGHTLAAAVLTGVQRSCKCGGADVARGTSSSNLLIWLSYSPLQTQCRPCQQLSLRLYKLSQVAKSHQFGEELMFSCVPAAPGGPNMVPIQSELSHTQH
jgi:hypothetical protein